MGPSAESTAPSARPSSSTCICMHARAYACMRMHACIHGTFGKTKFKARSGRSIVGYTRANTRMRICMHTHAHAHVTCTRTRAHNTYLYMDMCMYMVIYRCVFPETERGIEGLQEACHKARLFLRFKRFVRGRPQRLGRCVSRRCSIRPRR